MSPRVWLNNMELGVIVLRRKIETLFRSPSRKRIKEYKSKLNSIFNNLEQCTFLNNVESIKTKEMVEITTHEDDNLYAPCIKQILYDHFRIGAEIKRGGNQRKITISNGNAQKEIDINHIRSYIISNLYHQFNLYRGSIPMNVCRFIRELEAIVTDFGIFEPQKGMKVYWTIDAEAQLAYVDNRRKMSTNIFSSSKNKSALLLSETLQNISENLNIPHTYFIPMELLDYNGEDALGNPLCNVEENRKAVRELPNHASVAFHGYHHDEYRRLWLSGDLTKEYMETEIKRGKALVDEVGIDMISVNRYPGLSRESFSLDTLEKYDFEIDTSDFIDNSALEDFSAYCRYRLLKLNEPAIRPSDLWEIPTIYADPYVIGYNKEKIENLIAYLKKGENYHNSEVALMFHDKIIGFPEDGGIVFNLVDGRRNRTGKRKTIERLQKFLIEEGLCNDDGNIVNEENKIRSRIGEERKSKRIIKEGFRETVEHILEKRRTRV